MRDIECADLDLSKNDNRFSKDRNIFCCVFCQVCVNGALRWLKHVKTLKFNLKIPALSAGKLCTLATHCTHSVFFRWLKLSARFLNRPDTRWTSNTCLALWVLWAQFSTCW